MSERAKIKRIEAITHNLYSSMPGAPDVPTDERGRLWGEVEDNQHYEFCNVIAHLIVSNSAITYVEPD